MSTSQICFYQDHLDSLLVLAGILPQKKLSILRCLIKYLRPDGVSAATRKQIRQDTGIPERTQSRYIQEFCEIGLIQKWRGPYDHKQCYYKLSLPVASSVLEFYAASPRKAETKSSKQVVEGLVHHKAQPGTDASFSHEEVEERATAMSSHRAPPPAELEKLTTQGGMPMLQNTAPDSSCAEPIAAQLDPEISAVLDNLERNGRRNTTTRFLTASGFSGLQLASDEKIVIDRDGLLAFLLDRNANSLERFCELLDTFAGSAQEKMLPSIDVPMSEPITMHLHRRLDQYPLGLQWLWDMVPKKDEDGLSLPDVIVRRLLLHFMKQNQLQTLDDVSEVAAKKHKEEIERCTAPPQVPHAPQLELRPQELSCKAIMDKFQDQDRFRPGEINLNELGDEEMALFCHCQAKFEREHANMVNGLQKTIQRNAIVKILMIVGRQNPELVGYRPERGDICEPRHHPCC